MISLITGAILTLLIIIISMEGKFALYAQPHSMIIVLGGAVTIFVFMNPPSIIKSVWRSIKGLFQQEQEFKQYRSELIKLAESKSINGSTTTNPLVGYAVELWAQGIDPDLFVVLLSQKKNELIEIQLDAVQSLKSFAKYPPALGMMGTVMGMVALFAELDQASADIGKNLALAMTATFFGLVLANGLVSPLADRLQVKQVKAHRLYTAIYEVLLLINQDEPYSLVTEEVDNRAA